MKSKTYTPLAGQNIISRGLPKTGQTIAYVNRDDGEYEAGWWKGRLNANNKTRFIIKTIGGDDIVLDRATGLMWARDGNAAGCNNGNTTTWLNGITYAETLTFAGFSDWRMPNIKELISITDYSLSDPAIAEPPFVNTASGAEISGYWSSTTRSEFTTYAWRVLYLYGDAWVDQKVNDSLHIRCVRKGL